MSKQQNLSRTKIVVALLASASLVACQTSNEGAGTGLGALLGAAAGGALGGKRARSLGLLPELWLATGWALIWTRRNAGNCRPGRRPGWTAWKTAKR